MNIWAQNSNSNKIIYKTTMNSIHNKTKGTKINKTIYFSSLPHTFSVAKQWNKYNKNSTLRTFLFKPISIWILIHINQRKLKLEKDHINKHQRCNVLPYDIFALDLMYSGGPKTRRNRPAAIALVFCGIL